MAGARDVQELVVGGSGDLFYAPVGTPMPAGANDALNAAFYKAGYINEDGLSLRVAVEVNEQRVWQQKQPVRRELVDQTQSLTAALAQWNAETIKLAYGGGQVVQLGAAEWEYRFPSGDDALDERAVVAEVFDGADKIRLAFQRASITEPVETTFRRSEMALLPVTLSVLPPTSGGSPGSVFFSGADFHS